MQNGAAAEHAEPSAASPAEDVWGDMSIERLRRILHRIPEKMALQRTQASMAAMGGAPPPLCTAPRAVDETDAEALRAEIRRLTALWREEKALWRAAVASPDQAGGASGPAAPTSRRRKRPPAPRSAEGPEGGAATRKRKKAPPQPAEKFARAGPPREDFAAVAPTVEQVVRGGKWVKTEHLPYLSDFAAHLVAASYASPDRYGRTPPGYDFLDYEFPHPNCGARARTTLAGELAASLGPQLQHQIFGLMVWRYHNTEEAKDVLQPLLGQFRANEDIHALRDGISAAYEAGPERKSYLFSSDGLRGGGTSWRDSVLSNLQRWWNASRRLAAVLAQPETSPQTWHDAFLEEIFARVRGYGNYWAKFLYGDIAVHLAGAKADLTQYTIVGPGCFAMLEAWGIRFTGPRMARQRQGLAAVNELRVAVQAIFLSAAHLGIERAREEADLRELSAYDVQVQCCEHKRGLRMKLHARLATTRKRLRQASAAEQGDAGQECPIGIVVKLF